MNTRRAVDTVVFARGARIDGAPPGAELDFEVFPGETFAIVGASGAGKTAVVEAIAGWRGTSGEFVVSGMTPGDAPRSKRRRQLAVAPSHVAFERQITVEETLPLFGAADQAAIEAALQIFDLTSVRAARIHTLSPSHVQALVLTVALLHDPILLVADDPAKDLDIAAARRLWDVFDRRRQRGRTTVFTTARAADAEHVADRIALIRAGRIIALDTPAHLVAACEAPMRIVFDLPRPVVAREAVRGVPGAVDLHVEGQRYTVATRDGFASIRALIRLFEAANSVPVALSMVQPTLEDAVVELTARAAA